MFNTRTILFTRASEDMSPSVGRRIDVVMFQMAASDLCVIRTDIIEQSEDGERMVHIFLEKKLTHLMDKPFDSSPIVSLQSVLL